MNFNIIFNQANIIEPNNFRMDRSRGAIRYLFFHFINPVEIELNGNKVITDPGAVILYTPNTPQIFTPYQSRLNHDYVDFEVLDNNFFEEIRFPLNRVIYPKNNKAITQVIKAMDLVNSTNNIGSKYEQEALFEKMLIDISRSISRNRNVHTSETNEVIKADFEELRINLYEDPKNATVSSLAAKTGFSQSYFNRLYKELFGIAPIKDLTNARLSYVKHALLKETSISDLVDYLGFSNTEYFYIWFKKQTGLTPAQYKQQN